MSSYCASVSTRPRWPFAHPPKLLERFEGGFATDGSDVVLPKEVVFVIIGAHHGG